MCCSKLAAIQMEHIFWFSSLTLVTTILQTTNSTFPLSMAPSHSVVSVSSDSELSPSKIPINEHDFDTQLVSADKKPDEFDREKEDDQEKPLSKRAGRSSSIKATGKNTPKKRPNKVEDSTPSKKTKTGNDKRRGNRSNKILKEESSDVQETDVSKHSVWTLSSDSEEKDDAALISSRIQSPAKRAARRKSTELKQNKADHLPVNKKILNSAKVPEEDEELSSHESSEFKESEEDDDDEALSGSRRQPASKGKTLRKKLKKTDNTISRKKKMNDATLPEEDEELSPHESFESQDGGETDDEAPIGSRRQPTPRVARKGKSLKKKPEVTAKPSSVHEASICEVKKESDASTEQSGPRVRQKEKLQEKIKNESDDLAAEKKKVNTSVKNEGVSDTDVIVQGNSEKQVTSSKLPLVLPEKVQRTVALVECEADSIDVSGDMGAVGRVIISDNPSRDEMLLDLKGTIYKTSIVPSRTFCVVTMGQSEAKIDAIMNDFIQLRPQSNVYDAETMVEGTLDGFSFDSEDEADKSKAAARQNDQGEDAEEQAGKKTKGKSGKKQGVAQNKGKAVAAKQPRKRKSAPKKVKGKK